MSDLLVWLVLLLGAPVGLLMAVYIDLFCRGKKIWQRSECLLCKGQVPMQVWLAQILGVVASCMAVAATHGSVDLLALAVILWCLIGLGLCDLTCFRLPDVLTGLLFVAALCLAHAERRLPGALLGALIGAGVLMGLRMIYERLRGHEGLGLGDVKLAAGLGAALGPVALPWLGLIASVTALIAVSAGAWGGLKRQTALPFGVFLCLAATALLALRLLP